MPNSSPRSSTQVVLTLLLSFYYLQAAADQGSEVEQIVVTASRLPESRRHVSQAFDVITREDIERRQVPNVTELLRQVAGLYVIQQGARGGVASVLIRGGEPNFTIIMIDGVQINDPTNTRGGSYDFSYLDLSRIDRIEIIRSPMSAIYGSDALSGVINIITSEELTGARLLASVGGNGFRSGDASFGSSGGNLSGEIGIHALHDDGDIEGASFNDWTIDGTVRNRFSGGSEIGLAWRYLEADSTSFPEESGGPEYAVIRDVDIKDVNESLVRIFANGGAIHGWRPSFSASRYQRVEDSMSPGIAPGVFNGVPAISSNTDFVREQMEISAAGNLTPIYATVLGFEWQQEKGVTTGTLDFGFPLPTDYELDRVTVSAFAELEAKFNPFVLSGSLRWDDPENIDDEISANLGVAYMLPSDSGTLFLNWGEGFKAPSFFALGHPLVGNPDLESETATSIDFGFRRQFGDSVSVNASVFHNEFMNLIDFDPVLFTSVNRSKVVTQGFEISGNFKIGNSVGIQAHVTHLNSDIKDSDSQLRGRPTWRGGIVANWQINDRWLFVASFLSLDEFYEASIPTGGLFLEAYNRLDLALSFDVNNKIRLGFAIDNALDADYFEAVGFPAAGMRGRINVSYQR